MLCIQRVAALRSLSFIAQPCSPTKAEPVLASLAESEAAQADVVVTVVAPLTVVVQLVLNVVLTARPAQHMGFGIEDGIERG